MQTKRIGHSTFWVDTSESTNSLAFDFIRTTNSHGLAVVARNQTQGKGQKGNTWESEADKNLTASFILHPHSLLPQNQFMLSKAVSLAVCDVLVPLIDGVSIKWPNDIYVNNSKIAGVLIENSVIGASLEASIVGIGLNVNQCNFSDDIPNPTSLSIEMGWEQNLSEILLKLCNHLDRRYNQMTEDPRALSADYLNSLFRKNNFHPYLAGGKTIIARIMDVKDSGELMVESEGGETFEFLFKEITYCM